ncbi:TIR domain-containing protein [Duganella zoogloeoides]|uniref:TIR domain-containing protein n=1 Tax=Duganella zoogloeoides TaxID=75659 RepID=A0ABZ0Y5U6_9BURK|nr:TIR domain-containing protein [Duganella zoogloeoides]WQH07405.1 TIR domain-containing protein [Duganella zoogloeoides]
MHVFVSHSWSYSSHYSTLANWVFEEHWNFGQALLEFRNYSIPKDDPIHNFTIIVMLKNAIYNQIAKSHAIFIPSGMYSSHSRWIGEEIMGAKEYGKPILAVTPWAQERNSDVVLRNANARVGWSKQYVVDGIWKLYYERNK